MQYSYVYVFYTDFYLSVSNNCTNQSAYAIENSLSSSSDSHRLKSQVSNYGSSN